MGNPSAALRNKGPEAAAVHPQDHELAGRLGETEASPDPSERRNTVISELAPIWRRESGSEIAYKPNCD